MTIPVLWVFFLEKGNISKSATVPMQELNDVRILREDKAGRLWMLEAERALIDSNDVAMLYGVRFISDKKGIELTAPYGRYEFNEETAEINGGVLIKLSDGSEARINSLRIKKDIIKSEEPVVIKKGNIVLKGKGIISEPESGIKILKDVRLEIQ